MSEACAVCGSGVPEGRPWGPGAGRCCSMECVQEQSRELYRLRFQGCPGQKSLDVFGGGGSG